MTSKGFRLLRPYLCRDFQPRDVACRSHLRFLSATRPCRKRSELSVEAHSDVQLRVKALEDAGVLGYPRLGHDERFMPITAFRERYAHLNSGKYAENDIVVIRGRSAAVGETSIG